MVTTDDLINAIRDAAWNEQRENYEGHGCGEECYVRFHNAWHGGYETAIAHAEAQHAERVKAAIELAVNYGGIDGAHHKMWVIDQMLRVLCGDTYTDTIREACNGEDGPNTYDWDTGIAP